MQRDCPIRRYRVARGITQVQLADALELKQSTIAGWETGRRPVSAYLVGRVSALTGIPIHELRPDLFHGPAAA